MYIDEKTKDCLKIVWDYMHLNQKLEKCDIIMGCGCANTNIPIKCAQLFKQGFGKKILFAGGTGKLTLDTFHKSEAEIFKDIAIDNGIDEKDIIIETKSTNTGDNFRFSNKLLKNKI